MGQIYRYKDENNNIIYVGLVYGNALDDIHRRIAQHKQDKWAENFKGTIETLDIPEQYIPLTVAETDALETHFINKYLSAEHTCNTNWQIGRGTIRFIPECIDQAAWKAVPPKKKTESQINRVQSKPVLIKSLYEDSQNLDAGYNLLKIIKRLIKQGLMFQDIVKYNEKWDKWYVATPAISEADTRHAFLDIFCGYGCDSVHAFDEDGYYIIHMLQRDIKYDTTEDLISDIGRCLKKLYKRAKEAALILERNYPGFNLKSERAQYGLEVLHNLDTEGFAKEIMINERNML